MKLMIQEGVSCVNVYVDGELKATFILTGTEDKEDLREQAERFIKEEYGTSQNH